MPGWLLRLAAIGGWRNTETLEYTPEELARLLADLEETAPPADLAERLAEALRESRTNCRLMLAWLDVWGAAHA